MTSNSARYGSMAALLVIVFTLLVFSWLTVEVSYPTFEFLSAKLTRALVRIEPFSEIAEQVGRFLWDNRALDLISQSFVIVVAVICSLALLKPEEGDG